jgi:hypothetical protein
MNAMLHQLSPTTVVTNFEGIAKATTGLISTNLPASELDNFAQLALKARSQKVSTVSFVPPAINTADPDIDKIHTMIQSAIDRSEGDSGGQQKRPTKGFSAHRTGPSTGGSIGSLSKGYAANETQDLSRVC